MFLNCQEETNSGFRQCGTMILSDALPVQLWPSDCDTFNEHVAQGVHPVCWCQPWNCQDEITLQFQETIGQTFYLLALDEDGIVLYQGLFSEIQSGVYQISFTPNDENICDEVVALKVVNNTIQVLLAPSSWTDGPATSFDTKNATQFIKSFSTLFVSASAYMPVSLQPGDTIRFTYNVTSGSFSGGNIFVRAALSDNTGTSTAGIDYTIISGGDVSDVYFQSGPANRTVTFVAVANIPITRLYIRITDNFPQTGAFNFTITIDPGNILFIPEASIEAKSDCLDIATSHDETIFIEYSNQRNYAGLIYENDSPDTTFGIRVPCRFVHEVEPEEDEAMELTSSIITTASQVKTQRLLEVKHAPYYWHKKLRRVLKHQTLTVFDKQWEKEEKYEVNEGNKQWLLKSATCLLTEKNSVVRNVL